MSGREPARHVSSPGTTISSGAADRLARPFAAIIFDWDGTAVVDRKEDAEALVTLAEALLEQNVWLVVVTGTHYGHVDDQFCRFIAPARRHHLIVCTNRGSEVYGFDRWGMSVRRFLRLATPEEDYTLSATAEAVRDEIQQATGLDIAIVYDRLNRRKIDLIPLPEWSDPPKSRISELLAAVEQRLEKAGWTGGLGAAISLTSRAALHNGLPNARVTSDVKHIEVGLTDKGDAVRWVIDHVLAPNAIPLSDVLVAGDEFGPLGPAPGSDDRLREEAPIATVVSVGVEPSGVPADVVHLSGGPERFRAFLADQVWRHQRQSIGSGSRDSALQEAFADSTDSNWQICESDVSRAHERVRETLFTISNGFVGVRGSLDEPINVSRRHTLVAGLFDVRHGATPVPSLIPGPDCFRFRLTVDGTPVALEVSQDVDHQRTLDMYHGTLASRWRLNDSPGRGLTIRTRRAASMTDRHLLLQAIEISVDTPVALALEIDVETDGNDLINELTGPELSVWRTREDARTLAVYSSSTAYAGGRSLSAEIRNDRQRWRWVAVPDEPSVVQRVAKVTTVASESIHDQLPTDIVPTSKMSLPNLLRRHELAWEQRWAASEVVIEGDEAAQQALRYALYQLISAADPDSEDTSIGARGLTGDAYLGHVFWDTDIFVLPFYTFTWPEAARAALMYRYHTLTAARSRAAALGYHGALYAWESADSGVDVTPPYALSPTGEVVPIRCGELEQHISADVAYAVWHYWQATGDSRFLRQFGAEILVETARFWASRTALEPDGLYHIRRVIGPDEYHESVDDNAYTNEMARWNLERAVDAARYLRRRWPSRWADLRANLDLTDTEIDQWQRVAGAIAVKVNPTSELIQQFEGFSSLEHIDLESYRARMPGAPIDVILGSERVRQSQIVKQADVVMLLALLWDRFRPEARQTNFHFYEARCAHGSSLSPPIHALVAARLGDIELAKKYFDETAAIDLNDVMSNAAQGIHIGSLGGLWQAVVFGFAGIQIEPDGIRLNPHLPENWDALRFPLRWRRRVLRIDIERNPLRLEITLERGRPLVVRVGDVQKRLSRGQTWRAHVEEEHERWQEVIT